MNKSTSSGLKTSSTVIAAFPSSLTSLTVTGASGTWIVYDSATTTTSGKTVLAKVVTGASEVNAQLVYDSPLWANEGIYVTQSGGTDFITGFLPA
jgi:hypothetical protein